MANHDGVGAWARTHLHAPKPSLPSKLPTKIWY